MRSTCHGTFELVLAISFDVVLVLFALGLSLAGHPLESRVSTLIERLGAASFSDQREIVNELLTFGPEKCGDALGPEMETLGVPAIASLLRSSDEPTAEHAAWALGELGSSTSAAVESLREALRDQSEAKRLAAARALVRLSSGDRELLRSILLAALEAGRVGVLLDLSYLDESAAPAVPAIARYLSHSDVRVIRDAALSLLNLGPTAAGAKQELLRATHHADSSVRFYSLEALAQCGCVPRSFLSELAVLENDEDELVRASAVVAMWFARNGEESPLATLLKASKDSNPRVRLAGIAGLQYFSISNAEATRAIEHALQDSDEDVRFGAWEIWSCSPK